MSRLRVVFLVNGSPGSPGGERAARIASALDHAEVEIVHRRRARLSDLPRFVRPAVAPGTVLYAVDLAVVPVAAGALGSLRNPLIVDTGDSPAALLRLLSAGRLRTTAADLLERTGYGVADAVVVRGPYHERYLRARGLKHVSVVPDGVDLDLFQPAEDAGLRQRLGLDAAFTVGISGMFTWFDRLGGGWGWELVHAIARRRDLPLHAVLIGDGPGLARLRVLAHELEVGHRLHLIGRVPYHDLARYLSLCDVCLLTLSNHPAGWVRTSGKLPGYLATGRYVLSSRVGTAADLLPAEMLLDYDGPWDSTYPDKLARRLAELVDDPDRREKGMALRALAEPFDYRRVAAAAAEVIRETAERAAETRAHPPRMAST